MGVCSNNSALNFFFFLEDGAPKNDSCFFSHLATIAPPSDQHSDAQSSIWLTWLEKVEKSYTNLYKFTLIIYELIRFIKKLSEFLEKI